MRIPVYTSGAQATNEAPGRRFSVRMDPNPYIKAELAKSEVAGALAEAAGDFATQRIKMINETQYNEAALRIEEEMRQAVYDFEKDRDFGNILDGKNKWGQRMDAIKNDVIASVESPGMRKKLGFEFEANEIQSRFTLRGSIDKKIAAAEVAALKARTEGIVAYLSHPDRTIDDFITEMSKLTNAHKNPVKDGRFNPAAVSKTFNTVIKDVGANVVDIYVGRTPSRAVDLLVALEQMHDLDHGKEIPPAEMAQLDAGGAYALTVLRNMEQDDAIKILQDAVTSASAFSRVIEAEEKKAEEAQAFVIESLKNRYQYFANIQSSSLSADDLSEVEMTALSTANRQTIKDGGVLSSAQVKKDIVDFLYRVNEVDATFQGILDKDALTNTIPFAETSTSSVLDDILRQREAGTLTFEYLESKKSSLTYGDFKGFADGLLAEQNAAERAQAGQEDKDFTALKNFKNDLLKVAKSAYQYDALNSDDSQFAKVSRAAYFNVANILEEMWTNSQLPDAEPLTKVKLNDALKAAMEETKEIWHDNVRSSFRDYMSSDITAEYIQNLGFVFSETANMVEELETWFEGETRTETDLQKYSRVRRRLKEFLKTGAFE